MNEVVLLNPPEQHWVCPNCVSTLKTRGELRAPLHVCRGLRGLLAPFVGEGVKAKVYAHERDDYVGGDVVRYDGEGRAVSNVTTVRDDGQDCTVFAPCATGKVEW